MSAGYGNVEHFACQYIRGGIASAYDRCSRAVYACVGPLGSAQTKFHYNVAFGGVYDSGSLGGDQGLMVYYSEHGGFYELRLRYRSFDADERFVREDYSTFRHCIYLACELEIAQIVEEFLIVKETESF